MGSIKIKSNFRRKLYISLWLIPDPLEKCVYKLISGSYLRLFQNTSQISSWCHLDGCVLNTNLFAAALSFTQWSESLSLWQLIPTRARHKASGGLCGVVASIKALSRHRVLISKICVTRTQCRIMSHKKGRLYCNRVKSYGRELCVGMNGKSLQHQILNCVQCHGPCCWWEFCHVSMFGDFLPRAGSDHICKQFLIDQTNWIFLALLVNLCLGPFLENFYGWRLR